MKTDNFDFFQFSSHGRPDAAEELNASLNKLIDGLNHIIPNTRIFLGFGLSGDNLTQASQPHITSTRLANGRSGIEGMPHVTITGDRKIISLVLGLHETDPTNNFHRQVLQFDAEAQPAGYGHLRYRDEIVGVNHLVATRIKDVDRLSAAQIARSLKGTITGSVEGSISHFLSRGSSAATDAGIDRNTPVRVNLASVPNS